MTGLWIDRLVPETVQIHQGSETMVVAAALGRRRAEDEHVAGDAEAALGSLTWDRGCGPSPSTGLQAFLWHELPRKWLTDREASCTSPLRWGGCWSRSGCPATRRSAVGLWGT